MSQPSPRLPDAGADRQRNLEQLERRLLGQIADASQRYRLIEPGDRIMACISGGKDSLTMLHLLRVLQARVPFAFSIVAVNLDQGQPGFPKEVLPNFFRRHGYEYRIVEEDTYSIVTSKIPEGKTYCSLCSRLRRGILYNLAEELGATKLALGHHRDDAIETLLLNLFYSGQMKSMPPRLRSDDGRNIVVRPLIQCVESDIARYAAFRAFPIIPCDLCGSQENLKRQQIKVLLDRLSADNPHVRGNLFRALSNIRTSHLLDVALAELAAATEAADDLSPPRVEREPNKARKPRGDEPLQPLIQLRRQTS